MARRRSATPQGALLSCSNGQHHRPRSWETIQLTVVNRLPRPQNELYALSGTTTAHPGPHLRRVLAYALWKTLDHLSKRAGLQTLIHKPDPRRPNASPKPRPMTPEVILRELSQIQIGDILLETTAGQHLALRRVARPNPEQARILAALGMELPERLSADRLL